VSRWRIPPIVEVEVHVDATPDAVYAVVSDVTRIAEWSHECRGAEWLDGATGPVVGARFRGRNLVDRFAWSRVCTITDLVPGRRFGYRTSGGTPPDSTQWTFEFVPEGTGTTVRQRYEIVRFPRAVELLVIALVPAHRDRTEALRSDLVRLGDVVTGRRPRCAGTP
jgi:uncharacterized protein YndB with AHSA1/START domain